MNQAMARRNVSQHMDRTMQSGMEAAESEIVATMSYPEKEITLNSLTIKRQTMAYCISCYSVSYTPTTTAQILLYPNPYHVSCSIQHST